MCINLALKTEIEFPGNYEHPLSGNEAFPPYPTYSRTWNQTKLWSFEEEEGNRHREEKKAPESEETLKGPSLANLELLSNHHSPKTSSLKTQQPKRDSDPKNPLKTNDRSKKLKTGDVKPTI
jgi:hypothetical protein